MNWRLLTLVALPMVGLATRPAAAQTQPPDRFKDEETAHWAYQAVERLRQKWLVTGYPDERFRGRRAITRYEVAKALDEVMRGIPDQPQVLPGRPGPRGPQGPAGPKGPAGPPAQMPDELANLTRLFEEFQREGARIQAQATEADRRIDALSDKVKETRRELRPFR